VPLRRGLPLMAGVSGRHSYRMTLAESATRFCRCPPDIIFPPFLGRKALPGQEREGGPDGPHGGWSKGFFITLLGFPDLYFLQYLSNCLETGGCAGKVN